MTRAVLFVSALVLAACTTPATAVVVVIEADPEIAHVTDHLAVDVTGAAAGAAFSPADDMTLPVGGGGVHFPARVTIAPRDGDATRHFELRAVAFDSAGHAVVATRVVTGFAPGRVAAVTVRLTACCAALPTACPSDQTCAATGVGTCACRDPMVDPTTLPDYDAGSVLDASIDAPSPDAALPDAPVDAPMLDASPTDAGIDLSAGDLGTDPTDLGMVDTGPPPCPATCPHRISWQSSSTTLPVGDTLGPLFVADLVGDHIRDVVLAPPGAIEIVPLGRSACMPVGAVGGGGYIGSPFDTVAFADLDRDGYDDPLAVGDTDIRRYHGTAASLMEIGLSTFDSAYMSPKAGAAFSGDLRTLYVGMGAELLAIDVPSLGASAVVRSPVVVAPEAPERVAVGRWSGIGVVRASVTGTGHVDLYMGAATSELLALSGAPSGLLFADLNGDGSDELIASTGVGRQIAVMPESIPLGVISAVALAIAVLDVDGDGRPEILYVDGSGGAIHVLRVLIDSTGPHMGAMPDIAVPIAATLTDIVVSDVDRDGLLDIVMLGTIPISGFAGIFVLTAAC